MSRQANMVLGATLVCLLAAASQARPPEDCDLPANIGAAEMSPDGTIALWLRAEDGRGIIGDTYYEVAPSDPGYGDYLEHLGGLAPGEGKPVPPWMPARCLPP